MSAKEKTDLKKDFITSVAGYPYITRDGLAESYFLQHVFEGETVADNKAAIEKIDPKTIKIRQEGFSVLPGSASDGPIVPVYEIAFRTLDDKKEYCTMLQSTNICKIVSNRSTYKWPKLEEAYMHFFGEELIGAHDALTDVMACKRIYFEGLNNRQSKIPQSPKFIDTDSRLQHVVD